MNSNAPSASPALSARLEERAVELKHNGRNCCQSVTEALTEQEPVANLDPQLLGALTAGFRTGMGGMEATCGALCGAVMVAGLHHVGPDAGRTARTMHRRFTELSGGASVCRELKSRTPEGKVRCACDDCVRHAVRVYCEAKNG